MGPNYPIKRYRQTHQLDHYLCQCGTVSHWIFTLVMSCVGYGRYRLGSGPKGCSVFKGFVPHRLIERDLLWISPSTNMAFLFDRGYLTVWKMDELPFIPGGRYTFSILPEGRVIDVDSDLYQFNGFFFRPYRYNPDFDKHRLVVYRTHDHAYTLLPNTEVVK